MSDSFETELSASLRSGDSANSSKGSRNNHYVKLDSGKGGPFKRSFGESNSADLESNFGGQSDRSFDSRISVAEKSRRDRDRKRSFNFSIYKRLLTYSFRQWKLMILANICLVLSAVGNMTIPFFGGKMIDIISQSKEEKALNQITVLILIICVVSSVFTLLRSFFFGLIGERVIRQLRQDLFEAIIDKDVEFYDSQKSGELLSRLGADTTVAQNASADNISLLTRNILTFIGSTGILFTISWKLTVVLLLTIPPLLLSIMCFAKFNRKVQKEYQDAIAATNNVAAEAFGNIRVVKAFSTEDKEKKFYLGRLNYSYLLGRKKSRVRGLFMGFVSMISFSGIVGIVWYGGKLVLQGEITPGELSSFMIYSITLSGAIGSIAGVFDKVSVAIGACEKLFEIIDYKPKIRNNVGKKLQPFSGNIELRNVDFEYPTKPGVKVLKGLTLDIKPGDVVAVVGASGSGKTSLVSVIERFYEVGSGGVYVDGVNLKDVDLRWYHDNIGYVSQEPSLFSGTIEDNITYGVDGYTSEQLEQAMKMANAAEFIKNKAMFPEGVKTVVGERGIKLSGGQKQRVAIARALIKNPKILIFDEATSALDAESEHLVQSAIDGLIRDKSKTVIIIAHRLSTVINCPRILVMKDGLIVEEGNHQQLLEKNGIYKALIERQLAGLQI